MELPLIYYAPDGAPAADPAPDAPPDGSPPGGQEPQMPGLQELLPEDLAGSPSLKKFDTPEALAKSYLELERSRQDFLRVPTEDASDESRQKFYEELTRRVPGLMRIPSDDPEAMAQIRRQLGAPENADGYQLPEMDTHGLEVDQTLANTFRGWAAKHGLTQEQYQGIVKEFTNMSVQQTLANRSERDADTLALSGEWGAAYNQRMTMITNFAQRTNAPKALVDALRTGTAGNQTSRWLYGLVEQLGGEAQELTRVANEHRIMAPAQAQRQIDDIIDNKQHPFWHPEMKGHREAKEKLRKLYEVAHPGKNPAPTTVGAGGGVDYE